MRVLLWLILYLPSVFLVFAVFVSRRRPNPPGWSVALRWLTLWTLPALVYQCIWALWPGSPYSWTAGGAAQAAPVGLWVLLGGRSVVEVFEATARGLTGHRNATMLDNFYVYLAWTALQCAVLVIVLLRRKRPFGRDPVALAIGVVVLVNALLAAHWPWWGT